MQKKLWIWICLICISWGLASCTDKIETVQAFNSDSTVRIPKAEKIAETAPPKLIQELAKSFDQYQPQVKIISPQNDQILEDTTVKVQLEVKDLTIFKNDELGMGPHLHFFVDDQPYQAIYSTDEPVILENLSAGTHTIRVFASRTWHESFKNEGAYAQTTFHVFTPSNDNNPNSQQPLLTYSRPQGTYGAEPIMLDFYLTNAPLHLVAQENAEDNISDWRIRVTVNGEDFLMDTWQSIYLQGFKVGKNWVKLEFIDENGETVDNAFNTTARVINYDPKNKDTLTRLVKGNISLEESRVIVTPNYEPVIIPEEELIPEEKSVSEEELIPEVETEISAPETPIEEEIIVPETPIEETNSQIESNLNESEVETEIIEESELEENINSESNTEEIEP